MYNEAYFMKFYLIIFISITIIFALPPEMEADRALLAAKSAVESGNYNEAKAQFEKVINLGITVPNKFSFHYGKVLVKAGDYTKAKSVIEKYLTKTGKSGEKYIESLELLNEIDKLEKQKAQNLITQQKNIKIQEYNRLKSDVLRLISNNGSDSKDYKNNKGKLYRQDYCNYKQDAKQTKYGTFWLNTTYNTSSVDYTHRENINFKTMKVTYHREEVGRTEYTYKLHGTFDINNISPSNKFEVEKSNDGYVQLNFAKIKILLKSSTLKDHKIWIRNRNDRTDYGESSTSYLFIYFTSMSKAYDAVRSLQKLQKFCSDNPNLI